MLICEIIGKKPQISEPSSLNIIWQISELPPGNNKRFSEEEFIKEDLIKPIFF